DSQAVQSGDEDQLFDIAVATGMADDSGMVYFDEAHRLPAISGYTIVVFPYDRNPEAADGYEYDTVVEGGYDLSPYSPLWAGFAGGTNDGYALQTILVNLTDGATTNRAPEIAFSQPRDGGKLAPDGIIRVQFSRPIDTSTLKYTLEGCENANCGGASYPLLTEELSRGALQLSLRSIDALSRLFGSVRLTIDGATMTYDGVSLTDTVTFELQSEGLPGFVEVPKPALDLPMADGSTSQTYASAVDFGAVYVFDSAVRDHESYVGQLYSLVNGTSDPSGTYPDEDTGLDLRWSPVADADGYKVFARNSGPASTWTQVGEVGPEDHLLGDGKIHKAVNLPSWLFNYYTGTLGF
ncbi:MAG: hypothetical protein ACO3JL_22020, partial [Myxococcota bacterium]